MEETIIVPFCRITTYLSPWMKAFMRGHFPENLIYPGALLLELVHLAILDSVHTRIFLKEIPRCNFYNVIRQEETFDIQLLVQRQGGSLWMVKGCIEIQQEKKMEAVLRYASVGALMEFHDGEE